MNELRLVVAAQAGDRRAREELFAAYLPVVDATVRQTLGGTAEVDDVVQDTLLRALRHLRALRTPESFRSWLMTIATRQISTHLDRQQAEQRRTASLDEAAGLPDLAAEELALVHAELSVHRRQVIRAGRWLDADDRALLSLWWSQTAGRMTRNELAAVLGTNAAHAGVRVQRMRQRLEGSRSVVAALRARPRCTELSVVLESWDGVPSPLWRKRILRHARSCPVCVRHTGDPVPLQRLMPILAVLPAAVSPSPGMPLPAVHAESAERADPGGAAGCPRGDGPRLADVVRSRLRTDRLVPA